MLIEKSPTPLAKDDIVALRLANGEELVGKIVSVNDTEITITKPILVQLQMVSATQAGVGFAPYTAAVDEEARFVFPLDRLQHKPLRPSTQIKANYIKATTGIELATGSIIK